MHNNLLLISYRNRGLSPFLVESCSIVKERDAKERARAYDMRSPVNCQRLECRTSLWADLDLIKKNKSLSWNYTERWQTCTDTLEDVVGFQIAVKEFPVLWVGQEVQVEIGCVVCFSEMANDEGFSYLTGTFYQKALSGVRCLPVYENIIELALEHSFSPL